MKTSLLLSGLMLVAIGSGLRSDDDDPKVKAKAKGAAKAAAKAAKRDALVEELQNKLATADSGTRIQLLRKAQDLPPAQLKNAVGPIAEMLADSNDQVVESAIQILSRVGPDAAPAADKVVESLNKIVDGSRKVDTYWYFQALQRANQPIDPVLPALKKMLRTPSGKEIPLNFLRALDAVSVYGKAAEPLLPELRAAYQLKNEELRLPLGRALFRIGKPAEADRAFVTELIIREYNPKCSSAPMIVHCGPGNYLPMAMEIANEAIEKGSNRKLMVQSLRTIESITGRNSEVPKLNGNLFKPVSAAITKAMDSAHDADQKLWVHLFRALHTIDRKQAEPFAERYASLLLRESAEGDDPSLSLSTTSPREILTAHRERLVPYFFARAEGKSFHQIEGIARYMGLMEPSARELISKGLSSGKDEVRTAAVLALRTLVTNETAADWAAQWPKYLKDPSAMVRTAAVLALPRWDQPGENAADWLPTAIELLGKPTEHLPLDRILGLVGRLGQGGKAATETLVAGVKSTKDELRVKYAVALVHVDQSKVEVALPVLLKQLSQKWGTPHDVVVALKKLGPAAVPAIPYLKKQLEAVQGTNPRLVLNRRLQLADSILRIDPAEWKNIAPFVEQALNPAEKVNSNTKFSALTAMIVVGKPAASNAPAVRAIMDDTKAEQFERVAGALVLLRITPDASESARAFLKKVAGSGDSIQDLIDVLDDLGTDVKYVLTDLKAILPSGPPEKRLERWVKLRHPEFLSMIQ